MKNKELTIHTVCRNEVFLYYAVKSVYNYAKEIILIDTGTTNELALEGIDQLLKEDIAKKIRYEKIEIGNEEANVIVTKKETYPNKKFGVGQIRQLMIDRTNTEFFLTLDGDEIYYNSAIKKIVNEIIPNLNDNIYQVGIPLIWFKDIDHTVEIGCPITGRIVRTNEVCMTGSYPHEYHAVKETKEAFTLTHKNYLIFRDLEPFCHFNLMLKPEKRIHLKTRNRELYTKPLPEVMRENTYYIQEFIKEVKSNEQ